jgi:hypothetical protein
MCSGSKEAVDAGGRGQSLDPRDGVQGLAVVPLLGEAGRYEDGMYEASDEGGGISGRKLSTDGAREKESDEVEGWYERWIGETLCGCFDELEYAEYNCVGLFFLGVEERVTLLSPRFASLGVEEPRRHDTASSKRHSTGSWGRFPGSASVGRAKGLAAHLSVR